jgi:hypothetical protein
MIDKRFLALPLGIALFLSAPAFAQDEARTGQEVAHLLDFVAASGCQFNRNGSWYDSKGAREHLQQKYEYLQKRKLVPSARAFIERAASTSSMSGKPYQVRCGNGQPISSEQWLTTELAHYRAMQPGAK